MGKIVNFPFLELLFWQGERGWRAFLGDWLARRALSLAGGENFFEDFFFFCLTWGRRRGDIQEKRVAMAQEKKIKKSLRCGFVCGKVVLVLAVIGYFID